MSEPPKLTLDLELAQDPSKDPQELVLDFWKGFSRIIKVIFIGHDPHPEFGDEDWCYYIAVTASDKRAEEDVVCGFDIRLTQALRNGLLMITDMDGQTVSFDHIADADLLVLSDGYWTQPPRARTSHHLTDASPALLRQFRRKLSPGSAYSLQFTSKSYQIDFHLDPGAGDFDSSTAVRREAACLPTLLRFVVTAGMPPPKLTMSFSTMTSSLSLSSDDELVISQVITSLARKPVRLALVDSIPQKNFRRQFSVEWSYNGFPNMLTMTDQNSRFPRKYERIWTRAGRYDMPSTTEIIAGSYRQGLKVQEQERGHTPAKLPMSFIQQPLGPETSAPEMQRVVLCPGDQLVQRYVLGHSYLNELKSNKNYLLRLKDHCCHHWTYVPDSEVDDHPHLSTETWPDHGPIWFARVSELGITLEQMFERAQPGHLFKLPYELRKEIYKYLRYGDNAGIIRFKTTP